MIYISIYTYSQPLFFDSSNDLVWMWTSEIVTGQPTRPPKRTPHKQ